MHIDRCVEQDGQGKRRAAQALGIDRQPAAAVAGYAAGNRVDIEGIAIGPDIAVRRLQPDLAGIARLPHRRGNIDGGGGIDIQRALIGNQIHRTAAHRLEDVKECGNKSVGQDLPMGAQHDVTRGCRQRDAAGCRLEIGAGQKRDGAARQRDGAADLGAAWRRDGPGADQAQNAARRHGLIGIRTDQEKRSLERHVRRPAIQAARAMQGDRGLGGRLGGNGHRLESAQRLAACAQTDVDRVEQERRSARSRRTLSAGGIDQINSVGVQTHGARNARRHQGGSVQHQVAACAQRKINRTGENNPLCSPQRQIAGQLQLIGDAGVDVEAETVFRGAEIDALGRHQNIGGTDRHPGPRGDGAA